MTIHSTNDNLNNDRVLFKERESSRTKVLLTANILSFFVAKFFNINTSIVGGDDMDKIVLCGMLELERLER